MMRVNINNFSLIFNVLKFYDQFELPSALPTLIATLTSSELQAGAVLQQKLVTPSHPRLITFQFYNYNDFKTSWSRAPKLECRNVFYHGAEII